MGPRMLKSYRNRAWNLGRRIKADLGDFFDGWRKENSAWESRDDDERQDMRVEHSSRKLYIAHSSADSRRRERRARPLLGAFVWKAYKMGKTTK